jgi:predicted SAM-dependent methyltransferase
MKKTITILLDSLGLGSFLRPLIRCLREQSVLLGRVRFLCKRSRQIKAYFNSHSIRALHLGASARILDGWLNSDLEPASKNHVFIDATKPFPLSDSSLDFVFSEHFIEHIEQHDGERCMKEIYRCLKPGGVMRVATPNLIKYIHLFRENLTSRESDHLLSFQEKFHLSRISPCIALNHLIYNWGHRFLYDDFELIKLMHSAGFTEIQRASVGKSLHTQLENIEQHAKFYGDEMNDFETMVFEATK